MKTKTMSVRAREMFATQGYVYYSSGILKNLVPGIKLPHAMHAMLMLWAISFESTMALALLMAMSMAGAVMKYHPMDHLYNRIARRWMKLPKLPRRPKQMRFVFLLTGLTAFAMIVLFMNGVAMPAYALGFMQLFGMCLLMMFDISMASALYNYAVHSSIFPIEWLRMKEMMKEA